MEKKKQENQYQLLLDRFLLNNAIALLKPEVSSFFN